MPYLVRQGDKIIGVCNYVTKVPPGITVEKLPYHVNLSDVLATEKDNVAKAAALAKLTEEEKSLLRRVGF